MTLAASATARTTDGSSPAKAWRRALELTAPIGTRPTRILSTVIEEQADTCGDAPALLSGETLSSGSETLSYRAFAARSNQYTRWALRQGLSSADTVCLMMANRPEYLAIWLGISRAGCTVALLNTNLTGASLAHSVNIVAPKHVIAGVEFIDRLTSALPGLADSVTIWVHGAGYCEFRRMDEEIERHDGEKLHSDERRPVTIDDRALFIYTSGTTGLPKAANVSHARLMQWSHWFAGMLDTRADDRLYNCLPLYHSAGGVLATGAVLVSGGSVVLRESFSASQFWNDVVRWDCTLFQYIGELCRYLLGASLDPLETQHRIRACCGNGLRPDIWSLFKSRFRVPRILEFYAATEGNVSLFNVEGKPGAIGRIPPFLAHRFPAALVRVDSDRDEPVRNDGGFCIRCTPTETGEAIGRIFEDPSNAGNRFEGYSSEEACADKILHNVFDVGDAWFRTGDLMRRDEQGYFYFVDRIGDTFRWKGENVATAEVEAVCYAFPGIAQAAVYGVSVPGTDGRAGMAALVTREGSDLVAFRAHLRKHLPAYAHPLFLRVCEEMQTTATFKFARNTLAREGYNPASTSDVIYFNHREPGAFVPLDAELYDRILSGEIKL
jgi:fatty-acyl-CoA synthase